MFGLIKRDDEVVNVKSIIFYMVVLWIVCDAVAIHVCYFGRAQYRLYKI